MLCPKCGSLLLENDQICKNCGTAINFSNIPNNVQQPVNNLTSEQPINLQPVNNLPNEQPINPQPVNNVTSEPVVNQQGQQSYNQPAWMNGYNPNPNFQKPKSSGNAKYVIIGVVIAALVFGAGVAISIAKMKKENIENTDFYYDESIENTETPNVVTKTYKVNFKGFTFSIPDNLVYDVDDEMLYIGNEEDTWVVQFELEQGSFVDIKNNKNKLPSLMQQSGYMCSSAEERTFGGVEYITMEIAEGNEKAIVAIASANAMHFICATAINQDGELNYNLLEIIAPIINSAEQTSASDSIDSNDSFEYDGFSDIGGKL